MLYNSDGGYKGRSKSCKAHMAQLTYLTSSPISSYTCADLTQVSSCILQMSDSVASVCGGDEASHRFSLFRGEAAHTTVCGVGLWQAVIHPCHSVAWLCVEDLRTRAPVAERWARGFTDI